MSGDARLRVLAEVSNAFAMVATDYRLLLDEIAKTTAYLVGDGCQVTLIEADGETLFNAASAHRDPQLESVYKSYLAGVGVAKTTSQSVSAIVARTGQPKLVADISPASVAAQSDDALRPLVARLNVHSFVVVPIRARGTVIGTLSLMRSGPGRGYTGDDLILLQDLADRSGLAIENARLYDQLERRVRQRTAELEAVNQDLEAFSYSVAHDLRAPLRSIDGFSRAVLDEYAERLDDTGREHLKRVVGAAQHMGQLIDGLLDLSRVSRADLRRERVDLSALARDVGARLAHAHPHRTVEFTVEPGLQANADRRLAEVVLTNLIGNAWKFTGDRASARIRLGARPGGHPRVFFVRDNGAGFPMAQADRLFGVFQRLHGDDEFEGTGIGLATVHRIVRRHGGRIWAESEVGVGATFFFILEAGEK
ncbi:MAG TPA: ATP-binding protein [Polyangia bacterium]|nr:ATP-binding protein [Polyangia bacterium]